MAISEIEKLERRYAENPQGLTFAPLAEVHRKNGDVSRALELLGPGLALHPDYIPASIVLGRCHLDLGDQQAAETAFTHVLSLDGENVIALKALAEITERLLRLDESERWLNTLLSVDRSNDEARLQLERVQASRRQAEMGSSASPGADLVVEPTAGPDAASAIDDAGAVKPLENLEMIAPDLETSSITPPPPPLEEVPAEPGLGWVTASDAPSSEEAVPLAFEDLEAHSREHEVVSEPVEPLSGLVGRIEQEDASHVDPLGESVDHDFHVETSEDIVLRSSGATEFQVPNASEEFFGSAFEPPPQPQPSMVSEPEPTPELVEPEPKPELVEPELEPEHVEPEPVAAEASAPAITPLPDQPPDPMMTESMAELLLSQGHREEALRVYRELEGRIGGDPRLQERIADLARPAPASPPPQRLFAAAATGGRSTRDFLRGVLASRPSGGGSPAAKVEPASGVSAAAETTGAPTRPAHDTLSLSSVFGEEATPTRPAVPAAGNATPGGVSYDEFFTAPASGGTSRPARSQDPKSDDLDQFHTWLQNLKR